MQRIAIATFNKLPKLDPADQLLCKKFKTRGILAEPIVWNDKQVDWKSYKTVIIRSTWDYHENIRDFRSWLNLLDSKSISVWNPINIIRWNIDKKYLTELLNKKYNVVPTIIVKRNTNFNIKNIIIQNNWTSFVLKPNIGLAGYHVACFTKDNLKQAQTFAQKILKTNDMILQPFIYAIKQGELSFIFFNKIFSHAIIKIPAKNDFRSNAFFGASHKLFAPDNNLLDQAINFLTPITTDLMYARVDCVLFDSKLMLMEMELIEPFLSFNLYPEGVKNFITAFDKLNSKLV